MPALGLLAVALRRPTTRVTIAVGATAHVGFVGFTFVQALRGVPFVG